MSNITNIFGASYGNGIIPFFHKDDNGNIISKKVTGRTYTIKESVVVLEEFPDLQYGFDIIINNLNGKSFDNNSGVSVNQKLARVEKNYLSLEENEYIVDIATGFIHFHPNLNGVEVKVDDYYGKGLWLIDDTRVIAEVIKKRNTDGTYSYDYKNLADTIASAKGFISKGTWNKDVKYDINNIVEYGGVIYIAKKSDGNSDQSPTTKDSEYWDAVIDVNSIIENHADDIASDSNYGHVKLTNATFLDYGVNKGVAATPKAVKDVMDKTNGNTTAIDTHTGDTGNPHKVTKAQVELGNVPNVSTNNQTPTYTIASTLSNLTSGEKLSAAFGKISKAISDYISNKADVENALETLSSNIEGIISLNKFENIDLDTLKDEGLYYLKYTDVANIQDGKYHIPTIYSDEYTDIGSDLTLIVSKTKTRTTEETTSGGIIIEENIDILINQVLFTHAGIYFRGYQASKGTYSSWEKVITSDQILDATETTKGLVTLSYDYTPPGDDEVVLQETSEAAHIEAVQNAYGELKSMIDTLDNKINSNGGTGNGDGSQTTDGGFIGGDETSATDGGAIGYGAEATSGGAIGGGATTESGGSVGNYAQSISGFAGGLWTQTNTGGAIGNESTSTSGGAVGEQAKTGKGFAGGYYAKAVDSDDKGIDAIQLGEGTNSIEKTLQVYDYTLMNADGTIPTERLSNIQEQLDSKQPTITGAASSIVENNLVANVVLVSDGSGKVYPSMVSSTELSYLSDATSNIQTQLNNKTEANIKKNPSATTGDIIDTHLTVGLRSAESIGDYTFTCGDENEASVTLAFVGGGCRNKAKSFASAIVGGQNNENRSASGVILGGTSNLTVGDYGTILGGDNNTAKAYNTVLGRYNKTTTAGTASGTTGDAFVVGIGTETARKNGFRVTYDGNCYAATAMNSTGADYAEYWEWSDGNPDNEDRIGRFVVFKGDKIQIADENSDIRKVGIVSGNPAIVGDNYDDEWQGMFLRDVYGRMITEHKVYAEVLDDKGNVVQKAYETDEYVLNPDYDPEQEYIPRAKRSEWAPVGTHGKLVVIDDGTCEVDGFCMPTTGGIATASDDGFYVMERIDETHIRVYIK